MSDDTGFLSDLEFKTDAEVDAVCKEVAGSSLINADLAPARPSQRTWNTWHIFALWLGLTIVLTTYTLASGLMEAGMNWWQALLTISIANVIVLVPMVLNAHVGVRYGVPFPVFVRSSFGTIGANFAALARALVACGWFGIQTWLGGLAISTILGVIWPAWKEVPGANFVAFGVFWIIEMAIVVQGMEAIKKFESWSALPLTVVCLWLFAWGLVAGGGSVVHPLEQSATVLSSHQHTFAQLFLPGLAANIGYWATLSLNIPDFTRFARSQRSQLIGQALGLPLTMAAFSFVGIFVTAVTVVVFGKPVWNPINLIPMATHNVGILVVAMILILIAQIAANMAANVVSPGNDFSNVAPRWISFRTGTIITGVIGILMFPWALFQNAGAYIFGWLGGYGTLLGAIAGVMIADYWIVRRCRLDTVDLYRRDGQYPRWNGIAFIAIAVSVLPVIPGFMAAAATPGGVVSNPDMLDRIYSLGWLFTFTVSLLVYWLLAVVRRRGVYGRTKDEPRVLGTGRSSEREDGATVPGALQESRQRTLLSRWRRKAARSP